MSYATIPTFSVAATPQETESPKMHRTIKQRWVDALRSGEYEQSSGRLHTARGYCCLGVLCDLYAKEHGVKWVEPSLDNPTDHGMLGEFVYLPKEVATWANVDRFGVIVRDQCGHVDLADMNDKGHPFSEIADAIDECL